MAEGAHFSQATREMNTRSLFLQPAPYYFNLELFQPELIQPDGESSRPDFNVLLSPSRVQFLIEGCSGSPYAQS